MYGEWNWQVIDQPFTGWSIACICVICFLFVIASCFSAPPREDLDEDDPEYRTLYEVQRDRDLRRKRRSSRNPYEPIWVLAVGLSLTFAPTVYAQSGWKTVNGGYWFRGKFYQIGVDGPVSSTCQCEMCKVLRAGLAKDWLSGQTKATTIENYPTELRAKADTALIPTPLDAVGAMLSLLDLKPGEVLVDPGCGDGRLLTEAVKRYGVRAVGIEINPDTVKVARKRVAGESEKTRSRVDVIEGDSRKFSFKDADAIALFLFPELIKELEPKFLEMPVGARVVSRAHAISGSTKKTIGGETFYVWENGAVGELTSFLILGENE